MSKSLAVNAGASEKHSEGDIFVMVAVDNGMPRASGYETFNVFPGETVRDVKLRLQAKNGHYSRGQMVIFGDRELNEHEQLAPLAGRASAAAGSSSDFLHLFVRLEDIERVEVETSRRSLSRGIENVAGSPPRAGYPLLEWPLTSPGSPIATPGADMMQATSTDSLSSLAEFQSAMPSLQFSFHEPQTVSRINFVHLMVRRTASRKLKYIVEGKVFELTISVTASSKVSKQIVEPFTGHDFSHIMYNGRLLESSAPLSHGLRPGTRLELAPVASSMLERVSFPGLREAKAWLESGHVPHLAAAGSGGSYFMYGSDGAVPVAVFKPEDEEPRAPNNPRGFAADPFSAEGLRKGVLPGEGASREVAAYLLDHNGFAGVPPTTMASFLEHIELGDEGERITELKRGSLQEFVKFDFDCEERGPSTFAVDECHRIMVLDLRLANCDRNGSNILARQDSAGEWRLTPIDHGYCLPGSLQDVSFEWMFWPQADVPFSAETVAYIDSLDADSDIHLLEENGLHFRPECLRIFRVCTALLKKGAAAGLTPGEIARLMSREAFTKSPLEKLHSRALRVSALGTGQTHNAGNATAVDEDIYLVEMHAGMDELLDEMVVESINRY